MRRRLLLISLFVLAPIFPSSGQFLANRYVATNGVDGTNTCVVVQMPCRTIQHAINSADSGDEIRILSGVYTESLSVILKNVAFVRHTTDPVTIQAAASPGAVNARTVTIIGPASGSTTVSFTGITIRNGKANGGSGGGISCTQNCVLNLRNVFVLDNSADEEGGGIYIDDSSGESVIGNAVISGNVAGTNGGGMRVVNSDLRLEDNVRVQTNTAGGVGGGISLNGVDGDFENVTIGGSTVGDGNTAGSHGGGLRATDSNLVLRDVEVRGNESGDRGGGINSNNTTLQAFDSEFIFNHSNISGGGLYQGSDKTAFLTRVLFLLNDAVVAGGGMVASNGGRAVLEDVEFNGNKAGEEGGGFWNNHDDTVLNRVNFVSNIVETVQGINAGRGGGMFTRDSSPSFKDILYEGNQVISRDDRSALGGGMYILMGSPTLDNVSFVGNAVIPSGDLSLGLGGGLYLNSSFPQLTNGLFHANIAFEGGSASRGGAIYAGGASPTLVNITITGNLVEGDENSSGGAIYAFIDSHPLLLNSIVWGNQAGSGSQMTVGDSSSSIELDYSLFGNDNGDIENEGTFEQGNFSIVANPLFVDAENGDLRLLDLSPALDAGHPDSEAFGYPLNENNDPIDLDGNPRFSDGRIDLGAFEFQSIPTTIEDDDIPEVATTLTAPWPNPVRSIASMELVASKSQELSVDIYDMLGRRVKTLYNGTILPDSKETIKLDATELSSGMYLIRATGKHFATSRTVTVIH